jgi:hypothetical protein
MNLRRREVLEQRLDVGVKPQGRSGRQAASAAALNDIQTSTSDPTRPRSNEAYPAQPSHSPIDDVPYCAESAKRHESNIHAQLTQLPPQLFAHNSRNHIVHFARDDLPDSSGDQRHDGRVPELGSSGVKGCHEVDDADEENALDWSGEGG